MKKITLLLLLSLLFIVFFNSYSQTYYSVIDVYTDTSIQTGDTLWILGDYTNPDKNILVEHYSEWLADKPMEPHTMLKLEGLQPPVAAWNGGWILVKGTVRFEANLNQYHPEDSLMAFINAFSIAVWVDGLGVTTQNPDSSGKMQGYPESTTDCDSCKFAILVSGGINDDLNKDKYWESIEALYMFKIDSLGYCEENVFVHYYKGDSEDPLSISNAKVDSATLTRISNSFNIIQQKIAECKAKGKGINFQLMTGNHGNSSGPICLLDGDKWKLDDLKNKIQGLINSCCSKIYAEFIQCFGGYAVDSLSKLDIKNKTKVYANSAANHTCGYSSDGQVHRYLKGKIDSLDNGHSYEDAVVGGKLAYDNYLQFFVNKRHNQAQNARAIIADPTTSAEDREEWEDKLKKYENDSTKWKNSICKSRNVILTPFKEYCQWEEYVVPPGGQLVLNFEGDPESCGNVTVYIVDPITGDTKEKVFNWNIEGSDRYTGNQKRRVVNGDVSSITTIKVHNDDSTFKLTASANGNQNLPEDSSNVFEYPGASFGGNDNSNNEFGIIFTPDVWIENIDQVPISLNNLPCSLGGSGNPGFMGGSFTINPNDIYASNMELHIDLTAVQQSGDIFVNSSGSTGFQMVNITGPGEYNIPLGDLRPGATYSFIEINAAGAEFSVDCWGIHSVFQSNIPNQDICEGDSATLAASGGLTYLWSNGETTATIVVSPTVTTTYSVTISSFVGAATYDEATVFVHPQPTANAGPDVDICSGDCTDLNASGGMLYKWNIGQTDASINVCPTTITLFTVTVTDPFGCSDTDEVIVTVNPKPTANAGPDVDICSGDCTDLNASGGMLYKWNIGQTDASINVCPTTITLFTVTVTDPFGCSDTDEVIVTVNPKPTANAGPDVDICSGDCTDLTGSGGGGGSFVWSTNESIQTINVCPTTTTLFTVTITDHIGCTDADEVTVTVYPNPTADAGQDLAICSGDCGYIFLSPGSFMTFTWSNGSFTQFINVCPDGTTTYTVTVTDVNGCSTSDEVTVKVNPEPMADATSISPVCDGETLQLFGEAYQSSPFPTSYCIPSQNNDYEWITDVFLGMGWNSSGQDPAGYGDYTTFTLEDLDPGGTYLMDVNVHTFTPVLWITVYTDFDRNGYFDPTEEAFSGNAFPGYISGLINVPLDASAGEIALRVILQLGGSTPIDPCFPGIYGETEDYKINIQ